MQTQQVGTDISADVSFAFLPLFTQTYQFKGTITNPNPGVYEVTINRGEGIDLAHAEVVVHYSSAGFLVWKVEELVPTAAGERRFRVTFASVAAQVLTDPASGSITIRRKVPSVN